jgi:hypothetical protein
MMICGAYPAALSSDTRLLEFELQCPSLKVAINPRLFETLVPGRFVLSRLFTRLPSMDLKLLSEVTLVPAIFTAYDRAAESTRTSKFQSVIWTFVNQLNNHKPDFVVFDHGIQ